ncbi:U32 family peptidase [Ruminococcus sp. 210702-SL.1.03]|uniref:U32 family peptidase n=1 Tax=Ruminococcus sp. 210702-SL.1.03 TaxID=2883233 RepID=UPI001D073183|nr:U32 family peptidase [Ruminococcus sp. 210702-SL.1.03]MCB6615156.1 U32 family peptidase [Ruminococcus sp. 210702-SL.1.03]
MAEILSPAGGPEQLFAAVQSGADAVYLGLKRFSARGSAVNFDEQQLKEAVSFCHQRGVKVYAAVNTMLFDGELADCAETLRILCETGVDAAIVQDPAVAELAQSCCPELELHASTQMTLHTAAGCEFARRLGYTRTVLSRELPADVIKELCKLQNMEIEIFVHGALCMSVSGQCLMSAVVGGRSANRGICAQPCRLPCSVKKGRQDHVLSLKDMSILHDLPELAEFGVDSLKIEGRMKRPEYAALSAYCAKKALAGEDYDERLLADVFSRGGFTDGYLKRRTGAEMFGTRTAEDAKTAAAAYPAIHELYRREYKRARLDIAADVRRGEPLHITATDENGLRAEFIGKVPEQAQNKPCDEAFLRKQLGKLGDTYFELGDMHCEIDDGLAVAAGELNAARRELCEKLSALREEHFSRRVDFTLDIPKPEPRERDFGEPRLRVNVCKAEQLAMLDPEDIEIAWLPLDMNEIKKAAERFPAEKLGVAMPRFTLDENSQTALLEQAKHTHIKHILCTNYAHIITAQKLGLTPHGAAGLNIANSLALKKLREFGVADAVISPEMKASQISALAPEIPIGAEGYGRLPLMLTVNCPIRAAVGCKKCTGAVYDRTGRRFPIKCSKRLGYTELLNSDLLCISDKMADFRAVDFVQIELFDESAERAAEVINMFKYQKQCTAINGETITRGLYYRGLKG